MNKIVKFGGSSLADATQFKKVANIIKSDKSRRFVVPSAPGKRFKDDIKVTDLLYQAYNAKDNKTFEETFKLIKARYQDIIDELKLNCSLEKGGVLSQACSPHSLPGQSLLPQRQKSS